MIPEDEIPVGSHYRARTDMMDNVSLINRNSIIYLLNKSEFGICRILELYHKICFKYILNLA